MTLKRFLLFLLVLLVIVCIVYHEQIIQFIVDALPPDVLEFFSPPSMNANDFVVEEQP